MPADLLLGVGNPWRRDDGAGHLIAHAVARCVPALETRIVPQLDVVLVEELVGRRRVIIADAALDGETCLRRIHPRATAMPHAHSLAPEFLLFLAEKLVGATPEAWLLTVRGSDFEHGEGLSAPCSAAVDDAVKLAVTFLTSPAGTA